MQLTGVATDLPSPSLPVLLISAEEDLYHM